MKRFIPRAQWIWRQRTLPPPFFRKDDSRIKAETNRFIYFRRSFHLEKRPLFSPAFVSADGRFKLYINGHFVLFGPGRCAPDYQAVEEIDMAPWLHEGHNTIAALVHSYGRNTSWYLLPGWEQRRAFGCGGFFFQGQIGRKINLNTGGDWRYLEADAWQRTTTAGSLGFMEIYRADLAPLNWQYTGFDDNDWPFAETLRQKARNFSADIVPFPYMVLYPRRPLRYSRIYADDFHAFQGPNPPFSENPAHMLETEKIMGSGLPGAQNVQHLLHANGETSIQCPADKSCTLLFDFKKIITGRPGFSIRSEKGGIIDIATGDRLEADGKLRISDGIPGLDTAMAHRYFCREGKQDWELFERAGFRYLQLTVRQCRAPLVIYNVSVRQSEYPLPLKGRFECSDPVLQRIWLAGAETVHRCMSDSYTDCPTREQRQWTGDAYIQPLITYSAFGESGLERLFLLQAAQTQQENGLLMPVAAGDFSVDRFFNIPGFSLYWIMAIEQYIRYTGKDDLLESFFPVIQRILSWFFKFLSNDGLVEDLPHWLFVDWAELDKRGAVTVCNAQLAHSLRLAARMAAKLGFARPEKQYNRIAARIQSALNRLLWDEQRQIYVDCLYNGKRSQRVSQHSNAAMIAFALAPSERYKAVLDYICDDSRTKLTSIGSVGLINDGVFDTAHDVVRVQPFYAHFLHRALAMAGRYTELIHHIRDNWADMADSAYGTFYEMWQIEPMTSFCHGFSATPTYDLSRYILGICPTETPGRFIVDVHRGGLDWARGAFPAPAGNLEVNWTFQHNVLNLDIYVPAGLSVDVRLPAFRASAGNNFCNDQLLTISSVTIKNGKHNFQIHPINPEF